MCTRKRERAFRTIKRERAFAKLNKNVHWPDENANVSSIDGAHMCLHSMTHKRVLAQLKTDDYS